MSCQAAGGSVFRHPPGWCFRGIFGWLVSRDLRCVSLGRESAEGDRVGFFLPVDSGRLLSRKIQSIRCFAVNCRQTSKTPKSVDTWVLHLLACLESGHLWLAAVRAGVPAD